VCAGQCQRLTEQLRWKQQKRCGKQMK
jgi:hypothetical protein